ncbi:hypothetical protein ABEB36_001158 [Hypothenemus hampei]|uniref:Uncharacterized protein n=1 Tax=Hypothenemus hampei TaxID=57062 RepID=A0ABD1FG79_HYPHA
MELQLEKKVIQIRSHTLVVDKFNDEYWKRNVFNQHGNLCELMEICVKRVGEDAGHDEAQAY